MLRLTKEQFAAMGIAGKSGRAGPRPAATPAALALAEAKRDAARAGKTQTRKRSKPAVKRLGKRQLAAMTPEQAALALAIQAGAREFATPEDPLYDQIVSFALPLRGAVKQRPRLQGGDDDGRKPHTFTPTKTRRFEKTVKDYAKLAMQRGRYRIFTVPVVVDIVFLFEGIESLAAVERQIGDLSNLEKAVEDAMNAVVYSDDNLILRHPDSGKFYHGRDMVLVQVRAARPVALPDWCRALLAAEDPFAMVA